MTADKYTTTMTPARFPTCRLLADWSPVVAATLALVFAVAAPGCGGDALARQADPAAARKALGATLDAWKGGTPHAAAPVRTADEDWLAGATLVSYKTAAGETPFGGRLRCPVVLTLKTGKGKAVTRRVVYDVATDPDTSVVRLD